MDKIKFQSGSSSAFFRSLDKEVQEMMAATGLLKKAKRLLYIEAVFYTIVFVTCYASHYRFLKMMGNSDDKERQECMSQIKMSVISNI